MPQPLAIWNPERDVWETNQGDLFSEHLDVYSETWPRSGTWVGGVAYELPTSAHPTDGFASSSSPGLPTPTAKDASASGGSSPSDATLTDAIVRTDLGRRPNPRHCSRRPEPPTPTDPDSTEKAG